MDSIVKYFQQLSTYDINLLRFMKGSCQTYVTYINKFREIQVHAYLKYYIFFCLFHSNVKEMKIGNKQYVEVDFVEYLSFRKFSHSLASSSHLELIYDEHLLMHKLILK